MGGAQVGSQPQQAFRDGAEEGVGSAARVGMNRRLFGAPGVSNEDPNHFRAGAILEA
jgi:hypothetical protein